MALGLTERRKISKLQGELVRLAEDLVDSSNGIWKDNKKGGLSESQLRNVAAVGAAEECVEVMINFIKYQMGRTTKDNWEWNRQTSDSPEGNIPARQRFGEAVIHVMNHIREKLAKRVSEKDTDEIWISLCRSFWGYVIRYAKYMNKVN